MATETRWASSHLAGDVSSPANAVGATDGSWTADSGNTNWTSRWALDNPSGELTGTQTIRVLARKDSSGGNDPTVTEVSLYENGVLVGSIIGSTGITSAAEQTLSGTFDASAITDQNDVEIEVATSGAGGPPSSRRAVQIDSIEWAVSYSLGTRTGTLACTDTADGATLAGAVSIAGSLGATDGVDAASFGGSVAVSGVSGVSEGADSAAFAGSVGDPSVSGSFAATEATDEDAFAGAVLVSGAYAPSETADAAGFAGGIAWPDIDGSLAAFGAIDTVGFAGSALVSGAFSGSEVADVSSFLAGKQCRWAYRTNFWFSAP